VAERVVLDAGSPGEWLAGVGLSRFSAGRWVQTETLYRFSPWTFEAERVPSVDRVVEALACLGPPPKTRWLNHRGQGSTSKTIAMLITALDHVTDLAEIGSSDQDRTKTANSWEIDDAWQAAPAAYGSGDPGRPTAIAALAMLGAYQVSEWPGHWPSPSRAVGHLWEQGSPAEHRLEGWIMTWRRMPRPGVPSAGPLGGREWLELQPPTWQQHVRRHLRIQPDELMSLDDVLAHHGLDKPAGAALKIAAREGRTWHHEGMVVPPPLRRISRSAWVWDATQVLQPRSRDEERLLYSESGPLATLKPEDGAGRDA
jgi:hypothetical protein